MHDEMHAMLYKWYKFYDNYIDLLNKGQNSGMTHTMGKIMVEYTDSKETY